MNINILIRNNFKLFTNNSLDYVKSHQKSYLFLYYSFK